MHSWKEPFAPTITAAMIAATTAFGVVAILLMFAMGALLKSPGVMFAALLVAGLAYLSQMLTTHGELLRTLGEPEDTARMAGGIGMVALLAALSIWITAALYLMTLAWLA